MTNRIRDAFDAYLARVGLADAGPVQRRELRRAFFAGAWEVLCATERYANVHTADAGHREMRAECEEFAGRVLEGKDWT